jgi:hypothetical protein
MDELLVLREELVYVQNFLFTLGSRDIYLNGHNFSYTLGNFHESVLLVIVEWLYRSNKMRHFIIMISFGIPYHHHF